MLLQRSIRIVDSRLRLWPKRSLSNHSTNDSAIGKVQDHYVEKTPITSQLWQMRKIIQDPKHDTKNTSSTSDSKEIITKAPEESKIIIQYNFSSNANLRDLYVDVTNNMLIGKLFEDLDALAGNIAHLHCSDKDGKRRAVTLVTASVDKILQEQQLPIHEDVLMVGQVAHVGKSSIVVAIEIHQASIIDGDSSANHDVKLSEDQNVLEQNSLFYTTESRLFGSFFTYVARDPTTNKAVTVNKLQPVRSIEKEFFNYRQKLIDNRAKSSSSSSLDENQNKRELHINRLIDAGCVLRDMPALANASQRNTHINNAILMQSTTLENILVCQPQNVNTAGKVFGGFIMHKAYDLAIASCYLFAGKYPIFLESDRIAFKRPVNVGDLLRLRSRVIYTHHPRRPDSSEEISNDHQKVVVEVSCQIVKPEEAQSFVSNTFLFTFAVINDDVKKSSHQLKRVLPVTREEAVVYLLGEKSVEGDVVN